MGTLTEEEEFYRFNHERVNKDYINQKIAEFDKRYGSTEMQQLFQKTLLIDSFHRVPTFIELKEHISAYYYNGQNHNQYQDLHESDNVHVTEGGAFQQKNNMFNKRSEVNKQTANMNNNSDISFQPVSNNSSSYYHNNQNNTLKVQGQSEKPFEKANDSYNNQFPQNSIVQHSQGQFLNDTKKIHEQEQNAGFMPHKESFVQYQEVNRNFDNSNRQTFQNDNNNSFGSQNRTGGLSHTKNVFGSDKPDAYDRDSSNYRASNNKWKNIEDHYTNPHTLERANNTMPDPHKSYFEYTKAINQPHNQ